MNLFNCGRSILAIETVSTIVNSGFKPSKWAFFIIKLVSKSALCATITQSFEKSRNSGRTVSIPGALITIPSFIPVSCSILNGIGSFGFTKAENLSIILPSLTFTAPISIILFSSGLKPVVSKSKITYEESKDCPAEFVTTFFKSSTK